MKKKMSAVRVTKIRDFDVTPPRKSAFQIETPPDVPRQHSLTIFSARRGGGKSVACTTYVKKLLDVGAERRRRLCATLPYAPIELGFLSNRWRLLPSPSILPSACWDLL